MSELLLLPQRHILEKLICFACREYLSCDPIRILPNNSVVCGRCELAQMQNLNTIRSEAFEKVAGYFAYPCKHPKCNQALPRSLLMCHEAECSRKPGCCWCCLKNCTGTMSGEEPKYSDELVEADDDTMELLVCAHCHGYLSSSPIFLRPNGQNVCYRCGPDFQTPPILRNFPLEAMLEVFLLKCSFRMRGCTQRALFGLELIKHEATCAFNPQNGSEQQKNVNSDVAAEIPTISGHIYAKVPSNHFLYKNPNNNNYHINNKALELHTKPKIISKSNGGNDKCESFKEMIEMETLNVGKLCQQRDSPETRKSESGTKINVPFENKQRWEEVFSDDLRSISRPRTTYLNRGNQDVHPDANVKIVETTASAFPNYNSVLSEMRSKLKKIDQPISAHKY